MSMWRPPAERFLPNQVEISNTIRKGFVNLARWLRSLIYSDVLNLGNREVIKERLNQTADEAGTLFAQFYGQEMGDIIKSIYLNYFNNVQVMIEAYKNYDTAVIEQQRELMYKDADELAKLLSRINRYWDEATFQALFYILVSNTENQIANLVNGDFIKEIESYDQYVDQIYRISDELTYGILKQFEI